MEALKRDQRARRREFDYVCKELEEKLKEVPPNKDDVNLKFEELSDSFENLQANDNKVIDQMSKESFKPEQEDAEFKEIREYNMKYKVIRLQKEKTVPVLQMPYRESLSGGIENGEQRVRNFKLPTIQPKVFSGKLIDWLSWWAHFQKFDEDTYMCGSDKFCYLMQSLQPNTDAYEIASGYPQSNENYPKVIDALKKRYGNTDLQLQIYIRQLLNLVISNVNAKDKIPVKTLYMKLDSHLRALKTLKLEEADPATWLFPMVESSLPEAILDNWQRSPLSTQDGSQEVPPKSRLDFLMEFLEKEVEIKQKIEITRAFAADQCLEKNVEERKTHKPSARPNQNRVKVPTMSSFHNAERRSCAFCQGNHDTRNCFRAKGMSIDDKFEILKKKGLCFRCCGTHYFKNCRDKSICDNCKGRHLTIICKGNRGKRHNETFAQSAAKRTRVESASQSNSTPQLTSSRANVGSSGEVALQTLLIIITNESKELQVRAFIDSGCERSYISITAARKLGLRPIGSVRAIHSLFGGQRTKPVEHMKYAVRLKSKESNFSALVEVREQIKICEGLRNIPDKYPEILEELHDKNVKLSDLDAKNSDVDILIGADVYPLIVTRESVRLNCGAVALKTKLGWTLIGELRRKEQEESISSACISMTVNDARLATLWDLETLGIRDPAEEREIQKKEELAREQYIKSIYRDTTGRYVTKLPWKHNIPNLPENREVAFKRLQSASKQLVDKKLFNEYDKILKDWENEGFIEKVPDDDFATRVHYLPHRPVIKPESSTTPVRPVFDGSCRKGKSPSLNDLLFTGEIIPVLILEILLRFREKSIAFTADIRKAFQMIGVDKDDRDVLRFLWWENEKMEKIVEYRHARVVFGVTSSPFILAAVLYHHLTTSGDKEFGEKILDTLYVDNCVSSEDSTEEYQAFRERATQLLKEAGMELRMWLSNKEDLDNEQTAVVSILGMMWDRKKDELFVNMKKFSVPDKVTKRSILSVIQKIYDPIGYTSPCLIPMKLMMQKSWMSKKKWDELASYEDTRTVLKWCTEAKQIEKIRIPRCFTDGVTERGYWSLHIFCDASKDAFAAVVFLRIHYGEVKIQLLSAKSRVAPTRRMTIPKLELLSCVVGTRQLCMVRKALKIEGVKEYYYTDSTTALAWIRRNDQWGTFVANRVKKIHDICNSEDWRHVPGNANPADLPSRGCMPSELVRLEWHKGPTWLKDEEDQWPRTNEEYNEDEIATEVVKTVKMASCVVLDQLPGSWSLNKKIRMMGYWLRYLAFKFFKRKELVKKGPLNKEEFEIADTVFFRRIQRETFQDKGQERLAGMEIIKDNEWGMLRVKTRLTYREDLGSYRYPVVLPYEREEVKQLIRDLHEENSHAGVDCLKTIIREKFWILKARKTIKAILNKCVRCKRLSAKPVIPEPAPLPLDRIKEAEVFEVVGVDLAGPLILKNGNKVWLVIFTCGVYRAVHFEIVHRITTIAFIKALESFVEKFRRPAVIYSDNGTNFRGANNLFRKVDWSVVEHDKRAADIKWKFNPVTSSWWGGWWERLIRTAKDLLKRTVGNKSLRLEELKAVVKNIGEVMNNRPLTYASEDINDLEPLTPALFLHPFGSATLPERELTEGETMRFRLKYVDTLRKELKQRFLKEYLSMLVNRNYKKATSELRVGELVLVGCDNLKRIEWPLGRVMELLPGKDGPSRLMRIKTVGGEITRSAQRLYKLEADSDCDISRDQVGVTRSGRRVNLPQRFNY